jgi:tetratricopeptide (TPR) repeat protein
MKSAPREEQEAFYSIAFETSQWVVFDDLNLPLVQHFGKQYLKLKQPSEPGDKLYVDIRILRNTIDEVFAAGAPGVEQKKKLKRRLDQYQHKVQTDSSDAAKYQMHLALSEYNILLERDPYAALAHLYMAQGFIHAIPQPLLMEECSATSAMRADVEFMLGNVETSYKRYEAIWADPEMQLYIKRDFYHTIRFAEVAAIVGNLDRARDILDRRIDSGTDNLFIARKYVRYAVIALLDKNMDEARRYIEEAFRYNSGRSYAYLTDIRLRFLEVVTAYMAQDWHLASTLIARTLQFMHRKKVRIAASDYGYYFKFVNAAIRYRETGNPIPQKIIERIKRNGHTRFFSLLLEKVGDGVVALRTMAVFGAMSI